MPMAYQNIEPKGYESNTNKCGYSYPKAYTATPNGRAVCGESRTHGSVRGAEKRFSVPTLLHPYVSLG